MPHGFSYYPDFITEDEERRILNVISGLELHPLVFRGFEAKRNVESYGYSYHFDTRSISKGKPVPESLSFIVEKAAARLRLPPGEIAQMLVTEYPPGSVINWHRDAPPFDMIIGLSLQSDCIFRMRPYDKARQGRKAILSRTVKRRSLYIMRDEARTGWEHSISPVHETRYSVTLRTLRPGYG